MEYYISLNDGATLRTIMEFCCEGLRLLEETKDIMKTNIGKWVIVKEIPQGEVFITMHYCFRCGAKLE